jgi:hypothetical protein
MIQKPAAADMSDAEARETNAAGSAALLNRTAPSAPAGAATAAATAPATDADSADSQDRAPLFAENELNDFRRRWQDVQGSFVDDPRTAVRNADELVAQLMTRLAAIFADERGNLEHEWDKGENVSTEDLRVALRRYRSFFDRLLTV